MSDRERDTASGPPEGAAGRSRSSRRPYGLAVLFLGMLVVAAWVGRDRFRPVTPGEPAPGFQVTDLDGNPVRLADYRGQVVLINIWATWCAPCREEMPSMEALYRHFQGRDFEILAVSVDASLGETDEQGRQGASKGKLEAFAREYDLTFPILHNPSGDIQRIYQTTGVPESFLVDRNGVIVRRVASATAWDHPNNLDLIQRLLDS